MRTSLGFSYISGLCMQCRNWSSLLLELMASTASFFSQKCTTREKSISYTPCRSVYFYFTSGCATSSPPLLHLHNGKLFLFSIISNSSINDSIRPLPEYPQCQSTFQPWFSISVSVGSLATTNQSAIYCAASTSCVNGIYGYLEFHISHQPDQLFANFFPRNFHLLWHFDSRPTMLSMSALRVTGKISAFLRQRCMLSRENFSSRTILIIFIKYQNMRPPPPPIYWMPFVPGRCLEISLASSS